MTSDMGRAGALLRELARRESDQTGTGPKAREDARQGHSSDGADDTRERAAAAALAQAAADERGGFREASRRSPVAPEHYAVVVNPHEDADEPGAGGR